jgi:hypothetical protein
LGLNIFAHFAKGKDEPFGKVGDKGVYTIKGVIRHINVNLVRLEKCELVR